MNATSRTNAFVEETSFGNWFLKSSTWKVHVLRRALSDLQPMIPADQRFDRILDVGCGFGHSFHELAQRFKPKVIVGLDADPHLYERASEQAGLCSARVELHADNASRLSLPVPRHDVRSRPYREPRWCCRPRDALMYRGGFW